MVGLCIYLAESDVYAIEGYGKSKSVINDG